MRCAPKSLGKLRGRVPSPRSLCMVPLKMGILDLADELLRIILEYVASEPEKPISLERRAYLSQESFKLPLPLEPDDATTIANFRLTCKRLSNLGVIHQFSRVTTRFSRKGLDRLQKIATEPHIAGRVKKFSYMVPFFYDQGTITRPIQLAPQN